MKLKNKISKAAMKILAQAAYKSAEINANSTCVFFQYQPKQSKNVKKLRKF